MSQTEGLHERKIAQACPSLSSPLKETPQMEEKMPSWTFWAFDDPVVASIWLESLLLVIQQSHET